MNEGTLRMQVGILGLGKMGAGMARRLVGDGHEVVGADVDPGRLAGVAGLGMAAVADLTTLAARLTPQQVVWLMLPAGEATRSAIGQLAGLLAPGALVIDGGNSDFRDAPGHAAQLEEAGIHFADIGVSGGRWGCENGYGLMVGAEPQVFSDIEPLLKSLAAPGGYSRVGGVGAGHLVKAIHNGVQYAVLGAYAEGYALLRAHPEVDSLAALAAWQGGSSIRSWLLSQILETLRHNPELEDVRPFVPDSGMGRWTAEEAIRLGVPTPLLTVALHQRFASRDDGVANKLLAASRTQVGGQRS